MPIASLAARYFGPAIASLALVIVFRAEAGEGVGKIEVCRHSSQDGSDAKSIRLSRIAEQYRESADQIRTGFSGFRQKIEKASVGAFRSGIPAAECRAERTLPLPEAVPSALRKLTLYFMGAPRGGACPGILPRELPRECEVFVLDAASLEDVGALAKLLDRRVTLASPDFARAMGVRARDSEVRFSEDGRTAMVREEAP